MDHKVKEAPVAVIVGGSSGIGYAFAHRLLYQGFDILVVARTESKLVEAVTSLNTSSSDLSLKSSPRIHYCVADCCEMDHCSKILIVFREIWGNLSPSVLVLSSGTFMWDDGVSSKKALEMANFVSKQNILRAMYPLLEMSRYSRRLVLIVGSHAGSPGFKAEIEKREGVGAVDDETVYIASMQALRKLSITEASVLGSVGVQTVLLEPGLVDTLMARDAFTRIGVDWEKIIPPNMFVCNVLSTLYALGILAVGNCPRDGCCAYPPLDGSLTLEVQHEGDCVVLGPQMCNPRLYPALMTSFRCHHQGSSTVDTVL